MVKIKQSILVIVIGLALAASISFAAGTWSNPTDHPTAGNTEAPINVGESSQAKSGFLSLGTLTSPTVSLNVVGASNFTSFAQFTALATFHGGIKIPTNAATGKVLTSDSSGNATWQTPEVSSSDSPMIDIKSKTCSSGSGSCELACKSGYSLISGGYKGEKQSASYPKESNNSWRTTAYDYSSSNDTTIYVICIKF